MTPILKRLAPAFALTALLCAADFAYGLTVPSGKASAAVIFGLVKLAGYFVFAACLRRSYEAGWGDAVLVAFLRAATGLGLGWLLWDRLGLYALAALAPMRWALWSACLRLGFRKNTQTWLEREGDAVGGMAMSFLLDVPALALALPYSGFSWHVC